MSRRCEACGGQLFLGESTCPHCRARVEPDRVGPPADGAASDGGPRSPAPPPEGIDLIVQKMSNDRLIGARDDRSFETWEDDSTNFDQLAEAVRPQRDRDGRVIVDLKHALIGAVVVAVICGLVYYRVAQVVALPGS